MPSKALALFKATKVLVGYDHGNQRDPCKFLSHRKSQRAQQGGFPMSLFTTSRFTTSPRRTEEQRRIAYLDRRSGQLVNLTKVRLKRIDYRGTQVQSLVRRLKMVCRGGRKRERRERGERDGRGVCVYVCVFERDMVRGRG